MKKGKRAGRKAIEASVSESREKPQPRVALVCDWLTNPGGAEKVLLELHRMYPDAPIFTSQYNHKKISWFEDADVRTGWMQIFPSFLRNFLGVFRQCYFSHLDLSDYDVVISVTGAEAKSVKVYNKKTGQRAYHICYCHVPTQYYWQKYDYYVKNPGFGFLNPLARLGLKALVKPLRQADYRAAQRPDQFVTISHYSAEQIQKYYNREAKIIFPAVDVVKFAPKSFAKNPDSTNVNLEKTAASSESSTRKTRETEGKAEFSTTKAEKSTKNQSFSTDFPQENANLSTKNTKNSTRNEETSTDSGKLSTEISTKNGNFSTESKNFSTETKELSTEEQDFSTSNAKFSTGITGVDAEIIEKIKKEPYFIISCRQVPWKRVDLAIRACQETGDNLLVVGQGPEHDNLVKLASGAGNIFFLPWQSSASLAELLQHASAYIFPSEEPFGIAAAEALAAGCPVLAYGEGGSRDIVVPGKNGLLFPEQTPASVAGAIHEFKQMTSAHHESKPTHPEQPHSTRLWPPAQISASVAKFSPIHFDSAMRALVNRAQKTPTTEHPSELKPRTLLDKTIIALLLLLPFALFMSYYPVITLGATSSMNLELSVPLIWLVVFDIVVVAKFVTLLLTRRNKKHDRTSRASYAHRHDVSDETLNHDKDGHETVDQNRCSASATHAPATNPLAKLLNRSMHFPGITDRKIFLLALFPLYATISVFWSSNPLRGLLTAGIIWALFLAVFAILFIVPLINLPRNFRKAVFIAIFAASLLACVICFAQSIADVCGVPRETTLLCRGCTYQSFGFPHPSGLAIEPQFMGNLLLAPTLLGLCLMVFYNKKSLPLTITTFVCSTTLFFTFSRGAIYAYAVALAFLVVAALIKKTHLRTSFIRLRLLLIIPIASFLVSLAVQGIMATVSPTSDTFVTATTKAIHHLSLGIIDLRPQSDDAEPTETAELTEEPTTSQNAENQNLEKPAASNSSNFSGYVAESTDVRLGLNTVALLTWRNAPGHPAVWQGINCPLSDAPCLGSQQITLTSMYFGVGLGGAGTSMHEATPNEVTSPKEIVQNQPISLLLELGIFGIDLIIFELLICFCPWLFSRRFVDGRRAPAQPDNYTNFWRNRYWILLVALGLAYLVTLNFFSGLPNALHIYLIPPLIFLLGGEKSVPAEQKITKTYA